MHPRCRLGLWASISVVSISALMFARCGSSGSGCGNPEIVARAPSSYAKSDLHELVERAIRSTIERMHFSAKRNTPWELIHAALGLGPDYEIAGSDGRPVRFVDYLRTGALYRGQSTFMLIDGRVKVRPKRHRSEFEGHPNQFLAYFAEMNLPLSFRFNTASESFTVREMLSNAQYQYNPSEESTFTTIAFAAYMRDGETWRDEFGHEHTLDELIALELRAKRGRLSCGGTHTDFALALATKQLTSPSHPILDAVLARLSDDIRSVRGSQRVDGSLCFPNEENLSEVARDAEPIDKVFATGHNLEWLVLALPENEFRSEWLARAVRFIANELIGSSSDVIDIGYIFHAIHGLRMYEWRCNHGQSSNMAVGGGKD
jgi:hypothetical protein